jgi:hypothetical protein
MRETGPFIYDGTDPDPDLVNVGWVGETGQAVYHGSDPDLAIRWMDWKGWSGNSRQTGPGHVNM